MKKQLLISFVLICFLCPSKIFAGGISLGADRVDAILASLKNKNVVLVANQTSCLSNGVHLLDTLLSRNVKVSKIFVPEHGFRGNADAGATIKNGRDAKTGIPITSLYGRNKKPQKASLAGIDAVVFDLQDVGARFYTYISTMHYVMEACAENNIECVVLDRPNPNDYIDGPVLEAKYKSFVGMHPIPVLHGLTVGELAQMINGEKWLANGVQCKLQVIEVQGWKHGATYSLPIKPSPNLPNDQSIRLYASLCFFEATKVSIGRGTHFPFQVVGFPDSKFGKFTFTPKLLSGSTISPLQQDKKCYGEDLREVTIKNGLTLKYFISFYKISGTGAAFFSSPKFMDMLAGTNKLRLQIIDNMSEKLIRESWENDLRKYKTMRSKYLLYPDERNL